MDVTSNKGIRIPEGELRGIRTGLAANNIQDKLRRNMKVFCRHPLSHLESRAIKSNRTDGIATLVGLKAAVNSHAGVAGETPLKRFEGG